MCLPSVHRTQFEKFHRFAEISTVLIHISVSRIFYITLQVYLTVSDTTALSIRKCRAGERNDESETRNLQHAKMNRLIFWYSEFRLKHA